MTLFKKTPFIIRSGVFETFLAETTETIEAAQKLRYQVFYEELGASPTASEKDGFDVSRLDAFAEHLVVQNTQTKEIVGTYRLLRREGAKKNGSFYTEDEFDVSRLLADKGEMLEVSRSCVHKDYRNKTVVNLLWRGLAEYILHYDVAYLFGCASFHGTQIQDYADTLSYLYYHHLVSEKIRPQTKPDFFTPLNQKSIEKIDIKRVAETMPPLLRGYISVGGGIGDGAFIDYEFKTIDVCVVVESAGIKPRFARYYNRKTAQERTFPLTG